MFKDRMFLVALVAVAVMFLLVSLVGAQDAKFIGQYKNEAPWWATGAGGGNWKDVVPKGATKYTERIVFDSQGKVMATEKVAVIPDPNWVPPARDANADLSMMERRGDPTGEPQVAVVPKKRPCRSYSEIEASYKETGSRIRDCHFYSMNNLLLRDFANSELGDLARCHGPENWIFEAMRVHARMAQKNYDMVEGLRPDAPRSVNKISKKNWNQKAALKQLEDLYWNQSYAEQRLGNLEGWKKAHNLEHHPKTAEDLILVPRPPEQ